MTRMDFNRVLMAMNRQWAPDDGVDPRCADQDQPPLLGLGQTILGFQVRNYSSACSSTCSSVSLYWRGISSSDAKKGQKQGKMVADVDRSPPL